MTNITIRKVANTDGDFLCELMNHPALMHRLHQVSTTRNEWKEAIGLWLRDDDEQGYILWDHERPIGWFAVNGLEDKKAYLKIAVLLPDYQCKGIGSFVISHMLDDLKAAGYLAVGLFVDCDNKQAQGCYQKCGFQVINTVEESWPDGSKIMQYEMEKRF